MSDMRYMEAASRLNLFTLGDGAGLVYWQPAGMRLYSALQAYILKVHQEHGYTQVRTPSLAPVSLFERSGHLARYLENMFLANTDPEAGEIASNGYVLRPMSCPNHIQLYAAAQRSYRELPMALFEFGEVFRNEPSGSLQTLFRMRQFCQDDSHVFVTPDGLVEALAKYLGMARQVYTDLGFEKVNYAISLRPERRFGSDAQWDAAEEALRQSCRAQGIEWQELPGEGAFYGPKIELQVTDKLGRGWQLGTMQLDYVLPERFDLEYRTSAGDMARPVLLHHAVLGSLERFIGILLETYGVNLPDWLHPYPAVVVPVSDKVQDFAQRVATHMGCQLDTSDEPLGAKLRHWRQLGTPAIHVVGAKEEEHWRTTGELMASSGR